MAIDLPSLCTLPLELYFRDIYLSTATGSIWKSLNGVRYLITNWHVVTGVDPNTGVNIHDSGARPDRIFAYFVDKNTNAEKFIEVIQLRDGDDAPQWFVHPKLGRKIDVVAIPFDQSIETQWFPANK